MAPVIWGLDLKEIQWGKFKSSYMWNTEYHLRRTKFIVYQCALIFCVISESLGTAALSDYISEQKRVAKVDPNAYEYNNDYVGAASYNIFAGVFVAFIFGAAFFFDLFWPERKENKGVRLAWKICGVLSVVFHLASATTLTVITFNHQAYIRGYPPGRSQQLVDQYKKHNQAPLNYAHNTRAIAAVAFVWPGTLSVVGSCILLFLSINHTEFGPGPKSQHARIRDAESSDSSEKEKESDIPEAAPAGEIESDPAPAPPKTSLPHDGLATTATPADDNAADFGHPATEKAPAAEV